MRRRVSPNRDREDEALAAPLPLFIEQRANLAQELGHIRGLMRQESLVRRRLEGARVETVLLPETLDDWRLVSDERKIPVEDHPYAVDPVAERFPEHRQVTLPHLRVGEAEPQRRRAVRRDQAELRMRIVERARAAVVGWRLRAVHANRRHEPNADLVGVGYGLVQGIDAEPAETVHPLAEGAEELLKLVVAAGRHRPGAGAEVGAVEAAVGPPEHGAHVRVAQRLELLSQLVARTRPAQPSHVVDRQDAPGLFARLRAPELGHLALGERDQLEVGDARDVLGEVGPGVPEPERVVPLAGHDQVLAREVRRLPEDLDDIAVGVSHRVALFRSDAQRELPLASDPGEGRVGGEAQLHELGTMPDELVVDSDVNGVPAADRNRQAQLGHRSRPPRGREEHLSRHHCRRKRHDLPGARPAVVGERRGGRGAGQVGDVDGPVLVFPAGARLRTRGGIDPRREPVQQGDAGREEERVFQRRTHLAAAGHGRVLYTSIIMLA